MNTKSIIEQLLRKQFEMVGLDYDKDGDIVKDDKWYMKYCWTEKQEKEFIKWARDLLTKKHHYTIRGAEEIISFYILAYGWTICKEGQNDIKGNA